MLLSLRLYSRLIGLLALIVIGCTKGPEMADIEGTVTLDGKPLEKGEIRFSSVDGKSFATGGNIVDGKFLTRTPIIKQKVEIESVKITSPPNAKDEDIRTASLVPEKYNSKTTLTLDVKSGINRPKFELLSK